MAPRIPLPDPGPFGPMVTSFRFHLESEQKARSTVRGYTEAAVRLAGWLLTETDVRDWSGVTENNIKAYKIHLAEVGYSLGNQGNQHRSLQQFFRWYAEEEDLPNPFAAIKPPPSDDKVVPFLDQAQLMTLIKDAEAGSDFSHRRDAAILRIFASSGARLSEIANINLPELDLGERRALVHGKGRKERHIKYDLKARKALDRYLRVRAKHPSAHLAALWLGNRRDDGMTASGIYQVIARRGKRLGIKIHPHMFRHGFSHHWLDNGGAEGDLMELTGWSSPQMLRRYGRSAKAARALRAYDRIDVMGGV